MVNITHKNHSLRKAIATAVVTVSDPETMSAIRARRVPKGDIFEFSRAAGLLAIKKTSDVIPDCHPLPVEYAAITYELEKFSIHIFVEVHTIYKTGVEVEAMHGASIVALTMYDMLKPIDKQVEINTIRLVTKTGGKSEFNYPEEKDIKVAIVVCSDSVSAGTKQDTAGKAIIEKLMHYKVITSAYSIIPDNIELIRNKATELNEEGFELAIFTGGTGLSPTDVTPEALTPLINRMVPGIMEAARKYGQDRTPYAMLSRGLSGYMKNMLILALPGSEKGAEESMDALLPSLLHIFSVRNGTPHNSK
ncbi:MAG: bifunctional molybdenum cofactor biosynthesis protein MoaC/MoaB [Flavitalea sp.]